MLLQMNDICKAFNNIKVLKNVSLNVNKGEVHALLGENGAGKSTLMNILTGVHTKDKGEIIFDSQNIKNMTVSLSENLGISFVHQELNLFEDLTVYENIFLNREYKKAFGLLDKKRMINETKEFFNQMGIDLDPVVMVSELKISQKQLLEIAKALFFKAKLLILDEPTTSLNQNEIKHLFSMIENLKKNGISFIFISHKMPEIFEISDRYTVLRNGEFIQTGNIKDITPEQITELMVGKSGLSNEIYKPRKLGQTALKVENWSGEGFKNINLDIKQGEIIGLTGLQGCGSSEFLQSIFGVKPEKTGSITVFGKKINSNSIHKAMQSKIAMLAGNRKENSVIPDMNLLENMYISEHTLSSFPFNINKNNEQTKFDNYKSLLNIRANSPSDAITSLSGGNQQKVFLARWLNTRADIFLLDNPTQGIDVGAKAEIYELILQLAQNGKTIIINTQEIPEIYKVADRCIVFYNGEIAEILDHSQINEITVMNYAVNAGGSYEG